MRHRIKRAALAALAVLAVLVPAVLVATTPTIAAAPAAVVASVDTPTEADTAPDAAEAVDAPAWTLVAYSDCPAGQSCLWAGEHGASTRLNLAFSNYDPVGTCYNVPFHPVGGWHSAKGGYGSGYSLVLYGGSGGSCSGAILAVLGAGQTWSSAFSRPYSVMIV